MADFTRLTELFDRYLNGTATPGETTELMACAADPQYADAIRELIGGAYADHQEETALEPGRAEYILGHIYHQEKEETANTVTRRLFSWPRIAAAASIILAVSAGGYFLLHKKSPIQQTAQNQHNEIAPGHNQATLTLANGKKIILTKGLNGRLARQGNTLIQVNGSSNITYLNDSKNAVAKVEYNTLSTANGEMSPYPLVLPDGTKVWLNAASSITFPTAFPKNTREVTITGEAYFEVAHNDRQPFKVIAGAQTIEDIGTHFDINAYDNEPGITTTLIEGSIKVSEGNHNLILKPGQQAVGQNNQLTEQAADTEMAVAWKNGFFQFDNASLQTVMRQFARWYNIQVAYEGQIPADVFNGKVYRNMSLQDALQVLSSSAVHYRLEGRKMIIIP